MRINSLSTAGPALPLKRCARTWLDQSRWGSPGECKLVRNATICRWENYLEGEQQQLGLLVEPMQVVGKIVHAFEWLSLYVVPYILFLIP